MKKYITIVLVAFLAVILLSMLWHGEYTYSAPVNEPVAQVDSRDDIQKLTDNFAEAYRDLMDAEEAHLKTSEELDIATARYNEAVDYLQTYTR